MDVQLFYDYLAQIRVDYSQFIADSSNTFSKKGINSPSQRITLVKMNTFTACMHVMNAFDPSVTIHMFTHDEMDDWMEKINYLVNQQYHIDWVQYY
jgi:hypothetical protein